MSDMSRVTIGPFAAVMLAVATDATEDLTEDVLREIEAQPALLLTPLPAMLIMAAIGAGFAKALIAQEQRAAVAFRL